jgi:HPt (histidine-containing phosphotransfer) domain-containing protein
MFWSHWPIIPSGIANERPSQEWVVMEIVTSASNQEIRNSVPANFDFESLSERIGGDMELLRELVDLLTQECPSMLAEIARAVKEGNASDLHRASHKMKGSVLQFSARKAAAIAGTLEEMGSRGSMEGAAQEYAALETEVAALLQALKSMLPGTAAH